MTTSDVLTAAELDVWAAAWRAGAAQHLVRMLEVRGAARLDRLAPELTSFLQQWPGFGRSLRSTESGPAVSFRTVSLSVDVASGPASDQHLRDVANAPFDLTEPPLIRLAAFTVEGGFDLLVVAHHIAIDGVSMDLLLGAICAILSGEDPGHPHVGAGIRQPDRPDEFWTKNLAALPDQHLPVADEPDQPGRPLQLRTWLSQDADRRLRALAQECGQGHAAGTLALFLTSVHRWSDQEDIVAVTQLSQRRRRAEFGMVTGTLPVRSRMSPATTPTRRDTVRYAGSVLRHLLAHRRDQLQRLLEEAPGLRRPDGTTLLLDYEFNHMHAWRPPASIETASTQIRLRHAPPVPCHYGISLSAIDHGSATELLWQADSDRVSSSALAALAVALERQAEVARDGDPWHEEIVLPDVQAQLLTRGDGPRRPISLQTATEHFAARAQLSPHDVAIITRQQTVTYAEVSTRAAEIQSILEASGVSQDDRVLLSLPRGVDYIASVLAVWGLGASFTPIEPGSPAARTARMIQQLAPKVMVCGPDEMNAQDLVPIARLTADLQTGAGRRLQARPLVRPRQAAYVLFTSGSTGEPKGVEIGHSAMNNHLAMMADLEIRSGSTVAQNAPVSFDVHVWQCILPLVVGGTVRVFDDSEARDPHLFAAALDRVTALEAVPPFLSVLARAIDASALPSTTLHGLRQLLLTGEAAPMSLVRALRRLAPYAQLVNAYGPAEAADDVTVGLLDGTEDSATAPLGPAARNVSLRVVDHYRRLRPPNMLGEIAISGPAVGNGYIGTDGRPSFVTDTWAPTQPMYLTGDLGWLDARGVLHYLGRRDTQVKVGGRRTELGEIEAALSAIPGIAHSAVVDVTRGGATVLVGFIVGGHRLPSHTEIRERLGDDLPAFMIPPTFIERSTIPVTENGKTDLAALRTEAAHWLTTELPSAQSGDGPSGLQDAWSSALGRPITTEDRNRSFFELGGDSFAALRLVAALQDRGADLGLTELYELRTLSAVEQRLSQPMLDLDVPSEGRAPLAIALMLAGERRPITDSGINASTYPPQFVLEALNRDPELEQLRRIRFDHVDGGWQYRYGEATPVELVVSSDLTGSDALHDAATALHAETGVHAVLLAKNSSESYEYRLLLAHVVSGPDDPRRLLRRALSGESEQEVQGLAPAGEDLRRWLATVGQRAEAFVSSRHLRSRPSIRSETLPVPLDLPLSVLGRSLRASAALIQHNAGQVSRSILIETDGRYDASVPQDAFGCFLEFQVEVTVDDVVRSSPYSPSGIAVSEVESPTASPLARRPATASDAERGVVLNLVVVDDQVSMPDPAIAEWNASAAAEDVSVDVHVVSDDARTVTGPVVLHLSVSTEVAEDEREQWMGLAAVIVQSAAMYDRASASQPAGPPMPDGADLLGFPASGIARLMERLRDR